MNLTIIRENNKDVYNNPNLRYYFIDNLFEKADYLKLTANVLLNYVNVNKVTQIDLFYFTEEGCKFMKQNKPKKLSEISYKHLKKDIV